MRVLVTGAAGFIGSHACEGLLTEGHEVVGFDSFDPFYDRAIKERNLVGPRAHERFRLVEGDLRDRTAVEGLFDGGFDVVVHLAARAGVRPSMAEPAAYVETNVTGTTHLLEAMRATGCDRFVFASSSSVYGNCPVAPFHEELVVNRPISIYAMTKAAGEELCHVYAAAHGLRVVCLRFFTVYGPRQRPEMAIHTFVRHVFEERPLPVYGDGSMERDFTYVGDVVAGIRSAVERVADLGYEVVNLGNDRPVRLDRLVEVVADATGRRPRVDHRPVPPGDVERTWADIGKARALLGYEPSTPLEEGMRRFVEWYESVAPTPARGA